MYWLRNFKSKANGDETAVVISVDVTPQKHFFLYYTFLYTKRKWWGKNSLRQLFTSKYLIIDRTILPKLLIVTNFDEVHCYVTSTLQVCRSVTFSLLYCMSRSAGNPEIWSILRITVLEPLKPGTYEELRDE